jgi:transposase
VGKTRPPYAKEFRAEAVRLVRESGKSLAAIANDLGVSEPSLRAWRKQAELDSGKRSDGLTTEEHAEVRRLRREVRILREERDILKKAAAFFARETHSTP